MKKLITLLFVIPLLLIGCRAHLPVAQESGKEDIAYLLFVSSNEYAGKSVAVKIDNNVPFTAKVVKNSKANRRGSQYGIAVGTRNLTVSYNGKNIYQKKIFVSTQEVKQIYETLNSSESFRNPQGIYTNIFFNRWGIMSACNFANVCRIVKA